MQIDFQPSNDRQLENVVSAFSAEWSADTRKSVDFAHLDNDAAHVSARLSALFTSEDETLPAFRFGVRLAPWMGAPGDYRLDFDGTDCASLTLHRVPQSLVSASPVLQPVLLFFLCCKSYVSTIERDFPDHEWNLDGDPARRMLQDAIAVPRPEMRIAQRRLWN